MSMFRSTGPRNGLLTQGSLRRDGGASPLASLRLFAQVGLMGLAGSILALWISMRSSSSKVVGRGSHKAMKS